MPTPERGLFERSDLDQHCLFELDEDVNVRLSEHATTDPSNLSKLFLAAVDPDGERKASRDRLCCWHPRELALKLRAEMLSDHEREVRYRAYCQARKVGRSKIYTRWQTQQAALEKNADWVNRQLLTLRKKREQLLGQLKVAEEQMRTLLQKQEDSMKQRQFDWERKKLREDC